MRNPCPIEPQNHVKIRGPPSTYGPSRPFSPLLRHLVRSDDGRRPPFVEDPLGFQRRPRPRPPRVKTRFSPPSLGSFGTKSPHASALPRAVASAHGVATPLQPAGRRPSPAARPSPPRVGLLAGPWRAPAAAENRVEAQPHQRSPDGPSIINRQHSDGAVPRTRGAARTLLGHGERACPAWSRPGRPAGGGGAARRRHSCPPRPPATLPGHGHSRLLHRLVSSRPARRPP